MSRIILFWVVDNSITVGASLLYRLSSSTNGSGNTGTILFANSFSKMACSISSNSLLFLDNRDIKDVSSLFMAAELTIAKQKHIKKHWKMPIAIVFLIQNVVLCRYNETFTGY
jgi:hypothetical protein